VIRSDRSVKGSYQSDRCRFIDLREQAWGWHERWDESDCPVQCPKDRLILMEINLVKLWMSSMYVIPRY
jgi:hypothetical protein